MGLPVRKEGKEKDVKDVRKRWTSIVGVAIAMAGIVLMVAGEGTVKSGGDFGQGVITAVLGALMVAVPVLIHNRSQKEPPPV